MGGRAFIAASMIASCAPLVLGACASLGRQATPAPATTTTAAPTFQEFEVGDCVTWAEAVETPDEGSAEVVPCTAPHLLEITGSLELRDDGSGFPDDQTPDSRTVSACTRLAEELLDEPLQTDGRFGLFGLAVTSEAWTAGARTYWCGLAEVDQTRDGTRPLERVADVKDERQRLILPPGTCHRSYDQLVAAPSRAAVVPCDQPHGWESIGSTRAFAEEGEDYPSPQDLDAQVGAACRALLLSYAPNSPDVRSGAVVASRLGMTQETWDEGEREFQCIAERARVPGQEAIAPLDHSIRG